MSDQSAELLEAMFFSSPDAIVVVAEDGRIESASPAVEPVFGYTPGELLGEKVEILLPEAVRSAHITYRQAYAKHPVARPMGAGLQLSGKRRNGSVFPVDVSLAPTVVDGRTRVAAFVRDATERRRAENLLRSVNEISRSALSGSPSSSLLAMTCRHARTLAAAEVAWIAVPSEDDSMVVAAADGDLSDSLVGAEVSSSTSLAARAMQEADTVSIPNMGAEEAVLEPARSAGLGAGLYLPMLTEDGPIAALVVARARDGAGFATSDVATLEGFASAAAVVLALGTARESLDQLRLTSEHERIARDLHDTVIQRLFAVGMGLQAAERLAAGSVGERVHAAVETIDEVIREIRETIFDLNRPAGAEPDVRQQVRQVALEAAAQLGYRPRVTFRGPVEAAMTADLLKNLLPVLREALSNTARHAQASQSDVVLSATSGSVTLTVSDDGIGPADTPTAGHGVANMAARAAELGGSMSLTARFPTGTLLQWQAPLAADHR